jgi:hypothetical protein
VGRVQNQPEIGGQVFRVDRKVGAASLRVGKVGVNKYASEIAQMITQENCCFILPPKDVIFFSMIENIL